MLAVIVAVADRAHAGEMGREARCARTGALTKGVLIDLHPSTFRPGDTASTIAYLSVHFWPMVPNEAKLFALDHPPAPYSIYFTAAVKNIYFAAGRAGSHR
jgi:hypothetical protein